MIATVESFATGPMWAGFIVFVLAMLALELFVFGGRKAHRVHVKEALAWVIAWVWPRARFRWPCPGSICRFSGRCPSSAASSSSGSQPA
jgi:hypothetical protein